MDIIISFKDISEICVRRLIMNFFEKYVNPCLGKNLIRLKMDKSFSKGEGCWLYDVEGNRYLDMIASYGALPFGYNPPEIWEAIGQVGQRREPSFIQPSNLNAAGDLARMLVELAPEGLKYVTFTNSGAESVEASIKLCRAATGRTGILSTQNSFHGKTLGALSATGKKHYQDVFKVPVEGFEFVPYGDIEAIETAFKRKPDYYAAFIVEPIQGEGGIIVPPKGYLKKLRQLCSSFGVLLVIDEIQTGLGRTGQLFACQEEGIIPDVMLLAKALGGGIMPIGACLCTEEVFTEDFGLKHSSTFAGNTLACRVGIATLKKLIDNNYELVSDVAYKGEYLKKGLIELKNKYPDIIKDIRGKGLMLGIDFGNNRDSYPKSMLGIMAEQEMLASLIASYLLNVNKIRVAPTLNGSTVIRIEPPLIISKDECDLALNGIEDMLSNLWAGDTSNFLSYLLGKTGKNTTSGFPRKQIYLSKKPLSDSDEGRFAFLVHPVSINNYAEFDSSLSAFSENELKQLVIRWNDMIKPFFVSGVNVVSKSGKRAYGEFISVPRTTEELLNLPREQVITEIKTAVELGMERGAKIVGLGAYTSVVSKAGQSLLDLGTAITTGNSYTVVSAVEAVKWAGEKLFLRPDHVTSAVVGATGAIGKATSILLAEHSSRLILVGSPKWPVQSRRRLLRIAAESIVHLVDLSRKGICFKEGTMGDIIMRHNKLPSFNASIEEFISFAQTLEENDGLFIISSDIDQVIPKADVVICATSSPNTLLQANNLKFGAVVCDISRPGNVSLDVKESRPDVLVIDGGVIEVPGRPDLGWNFGFDKGLAYACMAETMLLALEHHYEHTSIGTDLNHKTIAKLRNLAEYHGFKVANLMSFNSQLSKTEWNKVFFARKAIPLSPSVCNYPKKVKGSKK